MQVFSLPPYYSMYKVISNLYPNYTQWNASLNLDPSSVIEIVCNPNNPDFSLRTPVYPTATHIYDLVYYWNHLVPTPTRYNETIMIFSLSKLAGLSARLKDLGNFQNIKIIRKNIAVLVGP